MAWIKHLLMSAESMRRSQLCVLRVRYAVGSDRNLANYAPERIRERSIRMRSSNPPAMAAGAGASGWTTS